MSSKPRTDIGYWRHVTLKNTFQVAEKITRIGFHARFWRAASRGRNAAANRSADANADAALNRVCWSSSPARPPERMASATAQGRPFTPSAPLGHGGDDGGAILAVDSMNA